MDEAHIWRVIEHGMATLHEMETTWSLDDVERANAMLDAKVYAENRFQELSAPKTKPGK